MATFRTSDGIEIAYTDEGGGRPIVFVHGWMMSGEVFHHQAGALAHEFRIVRPDLRGCGGSQARAGTHTVPRYADDVMELIRSLGLRDVTLVGWSMGGGIAMELVARHGWKEVTRIALIDFPPKLVEEPTVADKVCHTLAKRQASFARDFVQRMFLVPPSPQEAARLEEQMLRATPESGCEMYRAMRHNPLAGDVTPMSAPALLVFPERGWYRARLDEWKAIFPNHVIPELSRSKHAPFMEEPDAFNKALREFVAR